MTGRLRQGLRYTFRILGKNPGFTAVAILSLALGLGANTAIFTLINALLLRDLPVRQPERLVQLVAVRPDGKVPFSYPMFREVERGQRPDFRFARFGHADCLFFLSPIPHCQHALRTVRERPDDHCRGVPLASGCGVVSWLSAGAESVGYRSDCRTARRIKNRRWRCGLFAAVKPVLD